MTENIKREKDCLVIKGEYGYLRLMPFARTVVRVTYTKREDFLDRQSKIVLPDSKETVKWNMSEDTREIILNTGDVTVKMDKKTEALSYYGADGNLLFKERSRDPRLLETIDVLKTVYDEGEEVETRDGIDGIKAEVAGGRQVADRKAYHATLGLEFSEGEALYGLGSHEEGMMNMRGKHQYLYQQNMKATVPVLVSTKGYGVLMDCGSLMTFHDDAFGSYIWCDVVEELDFYVITGKNFDEVISNYRAITGQAPMLPRWAFGYMQSKERYKTQDELIEIAEEYRKRKIPLDTLVLDWQSWTGNLWGQKTLDPERFPDPDYMMRRLHELDVKLMISIWPNMGLGGDNNREFLKHGLMLGNKIHYNALEEEARKLYWKQANEGLFSHGIDAWWCDCTEPFEGDWKGPVKPIPEERMLINTDEAKKYLDPADVNTFSLYHSQGIYEGQRGETDEKRVVNLTRSSYAGQHRYSTITWSGDISANWHTFKAQIPAGLNFCATGEPYWTTDIGAFFVSTKRKMKEMIKGTQFEPAWFSDGDFDDGCNDLGYRELYTRWFQYGVFLPIFRSHGTSTPREIWRFGEPGEMFYDSLIKFIKLRYRLMPYIYSLAGMVTHKGYTMMRALAFDFAEDENVHNIDDQYMFGPSVMVCPVTFPMYYEPDSVEISGVPKNREVYLPEGTEWYDFWTGEKHAGGQTITANASIDTMPIYIKAGSIIPFGPDVQNAKGAPDEQAELVIYPGSECEFMLYDDTGDGYAYETGDYAFTKIAWDDSVCQLTLQPAGGKRKVPHRFTYKIVGDTKCAKAGGDSESLVIKYDSKKTKVLL